MVQLDDRILERLEEDVWSSPSVLTADSEFDASEHRIRECELLLANAELIDPLSESVSESSDDSSLVLKIILAQIHFMI